MKFDQYAKAVIAATIALGGGIATALADGHITATEWAVTGCYVVMAAAGVWATPNEKGVVVATPNTSEKVSDAVQS